MGKGPGKKLTPKAMATLERQQHAVELRAMGLTFREIGERLGGVCISTVQNLLLGAIKKTLQKPCDELRQQEVDKMDVMWRRMWANVAKDPRDYHAYEVMIKLLNRRARLLGLDAPIKREISGPEGGPIELSPTWRDGSMIEVASDAGVSMKLDDAAAALCKRLEEVDEAREKAKAIETTAQPVDKRDDDDNP